MQIQQYKIQSLVGELFLIASEKGLQKVSWQLEDSPFIENLENKGSISIHLQQAEKEIQEYFQGERKSFSVNLDLKGSSFQKQVWNELLKIPFGETRSYKEIASSIRNPKAARAVGSANGKNPLSIIIPCHRVISSDGSMGGYAGGLEKKSILLELEKS